MSADLFQETAERAAVEALTPLREAVADALHGADPTLALELVERVEGVVTIGLVRAFLAGAEHAAVELTAQLIEAGVNVELEHRLTGPDYGEDLDAD